MDEELREDINSVLTCFVSLLEGGIVDKPITDPASISEAFANFYEDFYQPRPSVSMPHIAQKILCLPKWLQYSLKLLPSPLEIATIFNQVDKQSSPD